MEGFRSLREGEPLEFTFQRSPRGLESVRVTGPEGGPCSGSERRQKPKPPAPTQKWKPKGDRCYNCGGLDHHAKECGLPPQPKKCHYCQSATHMVAHCPHRPPAPYLRLGRSHSGKTHYCGPVSPYLLHHLLQPQSQAWKQALPALSGQFLPQQVLQLSGKTRHRTRGVLEGTTGGNNPDPQPSLTDATS
ncbi:protein lin-28 homolog B-like [Coregonus clupeaformis]|uniref:protein lin-28 homolog B-like n=1 Tax=Coregonus clupeaformis TaxID=59861 RepID=UPI001E1C3AFA|nr:protein lin-28 homolog B-like [Coregonus clupeaformis]